MHELQAMRQAFAFQEITRCDEIRRIEAELRVLATARRPLAEAFAVQSHTNADVRLDADLLRNPNRLLQFLDFFDDDND
jgi:hypothetical protein